MNEAHQSSNQSQFADKDSPSYKGRKLTREDAQTIKACIAERKRLRKEITNLTNKSLAEKFGVSKAMIEHIAAGRHWNDE